MSAELKAACLAEGWQDLSDAIPRITGYVENWWTTPYLPWFTDHGPSHSRRVASYALDLASVPNLPEHLQPTALEKFILWSSAWLHDLGMQSISDGHLGDLDPSDFSRIRHEHPAKSAEEILTRGMDLGLPPDDRPLYQVIAYVARAHGTNYYSDSVSFLEGYTLVRNERVRGPLLAAILLMADELDLHYQRAKPPVARARLNPVSEAHALKHRRIIGSEICHGEGGLVRFVVTTERHDEFPGVIEDALDRWVVEKLRAQIALVEDDFIAGFAGRATLSRAIRLKQVPGLIPLDVPGAEVMRVIDEDNAKFDLINHKALAADVIYEITQRTSVVLQGRKSDDNDVDGREDVLNLAEAHFLARGSTVLSSRSLLESAGAATYSDVLVELISGFRRESLPREVDSNTSVASHLNDLIELIESTAEHVVVLISSIDVLPRPEQDWLLRRALPRIRDAGDVSLVVTLGQGTAVPSNLDRFVALSARELDRIQVTEHLARYAVRGAARAEANADLDYGSYKRLKAQHLIELHEEAMSYGQ